MSLIDDNFNIVLHSSKNCPHMLNPLSDGALVAGMERTCWPRFEWFLRFFAKDFSVIFGPNVSSDRVTILFYYWQDLVLYYLLKLCSRHFNMSRYCGRSRQHITNIESECFAAVLTRCWVSPIKSLPMTMSYGQMSAQVRSTHFLIVPFL